MRASLKEKLKKVIQSYRLRNEASMTGTMPVATGGVQFGGDIGTTPFAFSKKGARPSVLKQAGYSPAKPVKKSDEYNKLENIDTSLDQVGSYTDETGLVQHNDPEKDPNLVGYKQTTHPVTEGVHSLRYEQDNNVNPTVQQPSPSAPKLTQPAPSTAQPAKAPQVDVTTYDVQPDFTTFDQKLKNSTESLKTNLQKTIQDKILGKKVVIRASKGYKQPEADYTLNVTGVNIDYYYDRYVIVITGREENKQKTGKFFYKPGYKIKILGPADSMKPKDQYQVAKSQALVQPEPVTNANNTVTSDENSREDAEAAAQSKQLKQPPQA